MENGSLQIEHYLHTVEWNDGKGEDLPKNEIMKRSKHANDVTSQYERARDMVCRILDVPQTALQGVPEDATWDRNMDAPEGQSLIHKEPYQLFLDVVVSGDKPDRYKSINVTGLGTKSSWLSIKIVEISMPTQRRKWSTPSPTMCGAQRSG